MAVRGEAETAPRDAQAVNRRIQLKARDGEVDGVLLVLRDSKANRLFARAAEVELGPTFPQPGHRALELLRAGANPGGSAIVFIPRPRPRKASTPPTTG